MTAFHSTGILNIEAAFEATPQIKQVASIPRPVKKLLGTRIEQSILSRQTRNHPHGPDLDRDHDKKCVSIGEVSCSQTGETQTSELRTRGPYWLTTETVVLTAKKVLSGNLKTGFRTPASVFGSDFILEVDGSARNPSRTFRRYR